MDEIAELGEMLKRLRAMDPGFRVFGSVQHRYQLGPPLSEVELAAFEATNRVRLPEAYRQFLSTVGNGGAGPFYGLSPLGTFGRDLSRRFPFTTATDILPELDQLPDRGICPGVLAFCHTGCGWFAYLVVNGPTYGTIWNGTMEDFDPTGLTFDVWYRRWLERALRELDNERLLPRLRVGMPRAEVLAEVGGDWRDIPAELELDERDIVIKVKRRQFISAMP